MGAVGCRVASGLPGCHPKAKGTLTCGSLSMVASSSGRPTGVGRYLSELLTAWGKLPPAAAHEFVLCSPERIGPSSVREPAGVLRGLARIGHAVGATRIAETRLIGRRRRAVLSGLYVPVLVQDANRAGHSRCLICCPSGVVLMARGPAPPNADPARRPPGQPRDHGIRLLETGDHSVTSASSRRSIEVIYLGASALHPAAAVPSRQAARPVCRVDFQSTPYPRADRRIPSAGGADAGGPARNRRRQPDKPTHRRWTS